MRGLSSKQRLRVMEMVTEIASEAVTNPSMVWTVESQVQLVESLYGTMTSLLEDDDYEDEEADDDEEEEEDD